MSKLVSSFLAIGFVSFLSVSYSVAATNEISEEQMLEVKATCEAESKQATYPNEYMEQCIEENIQALKDSQGDQEKDAS